METTKQTLGLAEVEALAERAPAGQADKEGAPYILQVRPVAAGLEPFGKSPSVRRGRRTAS